MVEAEDRTGVAPGSDVLKELFDRFSPVLVLIDEWVAFLRNLYGEEGLPAGTFDQNLTFAQALTEAAKRSPRVLVVASLPASDAEVGGGGGREALIRLQNVFGRLESVWQPATQDETYEIVRRRLFQPLSEEASASGTRWFGSTCATTGSTGGSFRASPRVPLRGKDAPRLPHPSGAL